MVGRDALCLDRQGANEVIVDSKGVVAQYVQRVKRLLGSLSPFVPSGFDGDFWLGLRTALREGVDRETEALILRARFHSRLLFRFLVGATAGDLTAWQMASCFLVGVTTVDPSTSVP